MHPMILGAGLSVLAGLALAPAARAAPCPPLQARLSEHFISADCADCWALPETGSAASGWRLDWVRPGAADAPLSAAALAEADERLGRSAAAAAPTRRAQGPRRGPALTIESGPAWNGYFGVAMAVPPGAARSALPAGSSGWLALVELLPAGSEGTPVARALVRSVAGPLPLQTTHPRQRLQHLRALRWPQGAQPQRLQARGWIESPQGQVLAMAADRCPAY